MSFTKSLKEKSIKVWDACYQHPFVQELGQGTLPQETFQFYLVQDYKYLLEYAKVFALGALKSDSEKLMTNFTVCQHGLLTLEMDLHRSYMKSFGIELAEAEQAKTSLFNNAYTANMLSVGQQQGIAEILATLLPCPWTYYDFAVRLKEDYPAELENNPYKSWLDLYSSPEFLQMFSWMFAALDEKTSTKTLAELEKIVDIFAASVEFEYLFWDMAYKKQLSF